MNQRAVFWWGERADLPAGDGAELTLKHLVGNGFELGCKFEPR